MCCVGTARRPPPLPCTHTHAQTTTKKYPHPPPPKKTKPFARYGNDYTSTLANLIDFVDIIEGLRTDSRAAIEQYAVGGVNHSPQDLSWAPLAKAAALLASPLAGVIEGLRKLRILPDALPMPTLDQLADMQKKVCALAALVPAPQEGWDTAPSYKRNPNAECEARLRDVQSWQDVMKRYYTPCAAQPLPKYMDKDDELTCLAAKVMGPVVEKLKTDFLKHPLFF